MTRVPNEVESIGQAAASDQIDALCDDFEQRWRDGNRPRIEKYLKQLPAPQRDELLGELLGVEFYWRHRRGDCPAIEEYQQRFPGMERIIATEFYQAAVAARDAKREPSDKDVVSLDAEQPERHALTGKRLAMLAVLFAVAMFGITWLIQARFSSPSAERVAGQAERSINDVLRLKEAADPLVEQVVAGQLLAKSGSQATGRQLLQHALPYYQEITRQAAGVPRRGQLEIDAHFQIGRIYQQLEKFEQARAAFEYALRLQRDNSGEYQGNVQAKQRLADVWQHIGEVEQATQQTRAAEQAFTKAVEIRTQLVKTNRAPIARQLARSLTDLGSVEIELEKHQTAAEHLQQAQVILEAELKTAHKNRELRLLLIRVWRTMARLAVGQGNEVLACHELETAIAGLQRLHAENPVNVDFSRQLAEASDQLAQLKFRMGNDPEGERLLDASGAQWALLVEENPEELVLKRKYAAHLALFGRYALDRHHLPKAQRLLTLAVEQMKEETKTESMPFESRLAVVRVLVDLAQALERSNERQTAQVYWLQAYQRAEPLAEKLPENLELAAIVQKIKAARAASSE